jgi:predicted RNA-binding protein with PUA domain
MEEEEEEEEAWIKALEQVLFHRFLMKKEAKVIVAALVEEDLQDLKKPYHNRVLLMNRQPAKEPTEVLLRLLLVHERNYMLREV